MFHEINPAVKKFASLQVKSNNTLKVGRLCGDNARLGSFYLNGQATV
ncbi:MAG: hypothetical protein ACKO96_02905 [Flammeovirgaceae bacterium]